MSDLPLDANGNPIYPEGMIEAHTAFLAHFGDPTPPAPLGLQDRVKRGLAAALPLLKKVWLLEQQKDHSASTNHAEAAELAPSRAATSNIARCYLDLRQRLDDAAAKIHMARGDDKTIERLADAYLHQEHRATLAEKDGNIALATIRETRGILGASPTGTLQQAASDLQHKVIHARADEISSREKYQAARKELDEAQATIAQLTKRTVSSPPALGAPYSEPLQQMSGDPYAAMAKAMEWSSDVVSVLLHKLAVEDWADQANRKQCARNALDHYLRDRKPYLRERDRRRAIEARLTAAQSEAARLAVQQLPAIVTDEMIVRAIHYVTDNDMDMLNRQLLGLLNAAVGAKP